MVARADVRTDPSLLSHLKTQDMASWTRDGIAGLQSVVLYSLPELDGAIDTVVRCTLCCTPSPCVSQPVCWPARQSACVHMYMSERIYG